MFEVYQRFRLFYQRCPGFISDSSSFISDVRGLSAIPAFLSAMSGVYQRFRLFYQRCPGLISDSGSFISDVRGLSAIPAFLSAMSGAYQRFRLFYQRCPLFNLHWVSIHPTIKIQSKKDASQSNFAMHLFSIGRANTSI
ncbi:hypothetical protein ACIQ57_02335 [Lysinibacillus xylanilyticus]|uniref:hypothetical protein n=1 Tax=Lysinibacillus xylanilyticus TaxID=582475 RepID=UPI0038304A6D